MIYNVSDIITQPMVNYSVSNWDCNQSVAEWFVPSLLSPTPDHQQGDGSGDGYINLEINVNPDSFANAGGDKASYWQQDDQERYSVRFCIFMGVQTDEANPVNVEWSETQVAVTYDLTDGFALAVEVAPVRSERNATDAFAPEGFFCNDNGEPLNEAEQIQLAFPGTELQVCVRPNERARNNQMGLALINEFNWKRTDPISRNTFTQLAVRNGEPASNALTTMTCDALSCTFNSILMAPFFAASLPPARKLRGDVGYLAELPTHEDQVPRELQEATMFVTGEGIATVRFISQRYRRNLLTGEESWEPFEQTAHRSLQVEGQEFNIDLQIVPMGSDGQNFRARSSSSCASLLLGAVLSAFGMVCTLLVL